MKFIQKYNAIYHHSEAGAVAMTRGEVSADAAGAVVLLSKNLFGKRLACWRSERVFQEKKAHSKYHLLKSYDYDIIYSPVFVAIYVANRRKFVLT